MKNRPIYLQKLKQFQDAEPVKIVTGIRRCGKSYLLKLMVESLLEEGVDESQIVEMNFESYEFRKFASDDFYQYVKKRICKNKRTYLFFDEVQTVPAWEDAVNSFRVDFDCDIYITGSNSYMLSSEYATYLSGRFVEIKMYPLSFKEFLDFHDFKIVENSALNHFGGVLVEDETGASLDLKYAFDLYVRFGGMPGLASVGLNQEAALSMLDGIYSSVVIRDILERKGMTGQSSIKDPALLKRIVMFLADNIGSNVSLSKIGNTLGNEGLISNSGKSHAPSTHTVQSYVDALCKSYVFYEIKRFDVKGKQYLRTLGKYYIADIGLRNFLLGFRGQDRGHILENIVYFELLRRGFDVAIGKVDNYEIDFIAKKANEKLYVQVTETMLGEETRARELRSLSNMKDNYKKMILTLDDTFDTDVEGVEIVNAINWLVNA